MRRVLFAIALSVVCVVDLAFAADVPWVPPVPIKVHKKTKVHAQKSAHLIRVALLPKVIPGSISQTANQPTQVAIASSKVPADVIELPWVLDPLVATADAGKKEGSAGTEVHLMTNKTGTDFGPDVAIELTGHIIKTAQSTVRLDIHIGSLQKTVLWNADDVKSGAFKITLNEKLDAGPMPSYFPASALAFVTQSGDGHVAMVSLEKVVFRIGVSVATK